jgi:site-specific DNA-methyltransferase (adenine-specific)
MTDAFRGGGLPEPYYASGGVTLYNADALAVLAALPDASVDAVVTDPPYSSGGMVRGDRMTKPSTKYVQTGTAIARPEFGGDNRDSRSYGYWCALWLSECMRVAKAGSPILLFTDWRQLPITTDALQAGGWVWRGIAVWDKEGGCRPTMGRFASQCEYVVWGSNGAMPFEREVGVLPGVFRSVVKQADKFHMTGKPTPLMVDLLRIVEPGGVVLDPFMGSGSTGVAARELGLGFVGVEREESYAAIARQRIEDRASQGTLLPPTVVYRQADLLDLGAA